MTRHEQSVDETDSRATGTVVLSAHQPAYLPWLGYFDKIARADVFVYLDNVQFEKNSFTNRNKIKTPQGPLWLTVPVKLKGHTNATMLDTQIDNSQPWQMKHLKSIVANYRKAPFFNYLFPKLEMLLASTEGSLAEMCWRQLQFWMSELEIGTRLVRASTLSVSTRKSDLIRDLCLLFGANAYISGALGRDYIDEPSFTAAGVAVEYQDYSHPSYPQLWGVFEPYMSVVDYVMNVGPGRMRVGSRDAETAR